MSETKTYKVIDGPLSIRETPNGKVFPSKLAQGDEIKTNGEPVTEGGYIWLKHEKGWSALSDDDQTDVYMLDISNRDPNAPRIFRVWTATLSIRETANGIRKAERLSRNNEIKVDPTSRTEAGNYIWWKHDKGWSAERSTNGIEILMKEVFDAPAETALEPAQKAKIPEHWQGIFVLQVASDVKVRAQPNTNPRGTLIRNIQRGKVLNCDMSTLTEADGYYWVRHETGWSAIQSNDGKLVFLAEPGTIQGLIAIGAEGPKAEDLPNYRALLTRLPVNLTDTQWFQYFGNNMFAMRNATSFGYDRYSQGLHGGLDFGNSDKPVPVFAGVEAKYLRTEYPSANNARILLQKDDYTLIYQHITNIRTFTTGQIILPDTQLGDVEHHSINKGWDHLHFEIRFMKEWIVNPLLLFPEDLYNQIIKRFNPEKPNEGYKKDFPKSVLNFFYKTPKWTKWTSPLEQPMIKLAGAVIGPRAELPRSEW